MSKVKLDISMSLDGFVAGPNPTLDDPLGKDGELLHEWAYPTAAFNEPHGREGGETGVDNDVMAEVFEGVGASILGRRMFSGGEGPWESDPNPDAWWGDEPPFHSPVFVLTHHERDPLPKDGGTTFTFVTDGIESALEQAREAAGGKDVAIGGGASVAQQYLAAGLLDEIQLHVVPVLLWGGVRLFDGPAADAVGRLELTRAIESPTGTMHLRYRV
jgi:dihydrofolate reductase